MHIGFYARITDFISFSLYISAGQTEVALEELLSFWTGANTLPPLGFQNKLEIQFVNSDSPRLPKAYTCGLVLELCRGLSDPDLFRQDMVKAITWSGGFHLA